MGVNTVGGKKIEGSLPAFARAEVSSARHVGLIDVLNLGIVKRMLFLACDAAAIALSHWVCLTGVHRIFGIETSQLSPYGYPLFYLPFLLVVLFLTEGYQSPDLRRPEKELAITFRGVSLSFLLLVSANFIFLKLKELGFSRRVFIFWYLLALLLITLFRLALRSIYGALWRRGLAQQRVLWVGLTDKLAEFENLLSVQRYHGYRVVGVIPASEFDGGPPFGASSPSGIDGLATWDETISKLRVQLVMVCLTGTTPGSDELVGEILRRCRARGVDVEVHSDLFATTQFNFELDEFSGFFRFYAVPAWSRRVQRSVKFCVDVFAGLVGSLLTVLAYPLVAALIKLEDGGPIFYRIAIIGPNEEDRYYLKFRTMRVGADRLLEENPELRKEYELTYKLKQDPRVTRVGRVLRKYSLDEFPSFFLLLRGDISLVGPRAIMKKQRERYGSSLPKLLSIKPGLTGFWQVMGRQMTTFEERIKMDMFYIDHWSIWLDLLIIAKTFWKVFRAEGAY
jgi:exopolysaccharide biosynthesis polyprenyl glycosylphosphotransferase